MKLGELQVYQLAMDIGERVWELVIKWDYFAKDTLGKQLYHCIAIEVEAIEPVHEYKVWARDCELQNLPVRLG